MNTKYSEAAQREWLKTNKPDGMCILELCCYIVATGALLGWLFYHCWFGG